MRVLKKINSGLMTFIKAVLIAFGTLMTVLVIMNVILRYVFHSGISWSEEACRFLFIWVTFLGAILTQASTANTCGWISSWKCSGESPARLWRSSPCC